MDIQKPIAIVGGGLAGLTAANFLKKKTPSYFGNLGSSFENFSKQS